MSKKSSLALLVLVLMAMCLPAISIHAWQKMQPTPDDEASKIASDYLKVSPTYAFDVINGSMNVSYIVLAWTFAPPSSAVPTNCRVRLVPSESVA